MTFNFQKKKNIIKAELNLMLEFNGGIQHKINN